MKLGQRILTDRRFQLGQLLAHVRQRFPSSGKGAAGWGRFCQDLGLGRGTAVRYIKIAEQVAARPELAERRTFLDIYLELGLSRPPPSAERFAAAAGANVLPGPPTAHVLLDKPEGDGDAKPTAADATDLFEAEDTEADVRHGRPPLSERERRNDIYMVRLNTAETLRLRRLSGLLALRDAEVFREGLLALEEREATKAAVSLRTPKSPPAVRRAR